ncbi:dehydrogenase [Leisingera sp. JC1]|nr:dehydrogenase [Leisingera sp. JC1]
MPRKIIVLTGATSGFGRHTLALLVQEQGTTVFVGARGTDRDVPPGVEVLPLDLASLDSVRTFAALLEERLEGAGIDVLILNAGVHGATADQLSAEGFGLTFAVNHLAHYLLSRLLLPKLSKGGRLVITSSNMHEPPLKRLAPKGLEIEAWAHPFPGGSGTGTRSYCASKLCNLMTAQSLARTELVRERGIEVIAFNPGLTGGASGGDASALQKAVVSVLIRTVFPLIALINPTFKMNAPEHSGRMLADVATGTIPMPEGRVYVSLVGGKPTFPAPSALAQDVEAQDRLWRESARMTSLDR